METTTTTTATRTKNYTKWDAKWDDMYNQLAEFHRQHGHILLTLPFYATNNNNNARDDDNDDDNDDDEEEDCNESNNSNDKDAVALAALYKWVSKQRHRWKRTMQGETNQILSQQQIQRLVTLGMGTMTNGPVSMRELVAAANDQASAAAAAAVAAATAAMPDNHNTTNNDSDDSTNKKTNSFTKVAPPPPPVAVGTSESGMQQQQPPATTTAQAAAAAAAQYTNWVNYYYPPFPNNNTTNNDVDDSTNNNKNDPKEDKEKDWFFYYRQLVSFHARHGHLRLLKPAAAASENKKDSEYAAASADNKDNDHDNEEYAKRKLMRFVRYQKQQWTIWISYYSPLHREMNSNISLPLIQRLVHVGLGTIEHGPYQDDDNDNDEVMEENCVGEDDYDEEFRHMNEIAKAQTLPLPPPFLHTDNVAVWTSMQQQQQQQSYMATLPTNKNDGNDSYTKAAPPPPPAAASVGTSESGIQPPLPLPATTAQAAAAATATATAQYTNWVNYYYPSTHHPYYTAQQTYFAPKLRELEALKRRDREAKKRKERDVEQIKELKAQLKKEREARQGQERVNDEQKAAAAAAVTAATAARDVEGDNGKKCVANAAPIVSAPTKASRNIKEFDISLAIKEPIRWKMPNGKQGVAVFIPKWHTRESYRKSVVRTHWIDHVIDNLYNKNKITKEVSVDWFLESLFERFRDVFITFVERQGFIPAPTKSNKAIKPIIPWETHFENLKQFYEEHGHAEPDVRDKLGKWCHSNRVKHKDGKLPPEQYEALSSLPGFRWQINSVDDLFKERIEQLRVYKEQHGGNTRVPYAYKTHAGVALGRWVSHIRMKYQQGKMNQQERIDQLNSLGFDWEPGAAPLATSASNLEESEEIIWP